MAKKVYFGVNNVARNVKKMYFGVNNVARKVKKAYIGVGGVARPFFSSNNVEYYGYLESLTYARDRMASGNNNEYAFFAGGRDSYHIDAYDYDLIHFTGELTYSSSGPTSVCVGGLYASNMIVAGGYDNFIAHRTANAIGSDLSVQKISALNLGRSDMGSSFNQPYVIFAGGRNFDNVPNSTVETYDCETLTHSTTIQNLTKALGDVSGSFNNSYSMFVGGSDSDGNATNIVYAYDSDNVRSLAAVFPVNISGAANAVLNLSLSKYNAIFAGGYTLPGSTAGRSFVVVSYDEDLIQNVLPSLSVGRADLAGAGIYSVVLFAGGGTGMGEVGNVDCYSMDFTHSVLSPLNTGRDYLSGSEIGGCVIFAGGRNPHYLSTVEAYVELD